jgi:hypothetical protein
MAGYNVLYFAISLSHFVLWRSIEFYIQPQKYKRDGKMNEKSVWLENNG